MWGKIFGGFAGFAMGGPLGAMFGAAAGHAFDKLREQDATTSLPPWNEGMAALGLGFPSGEAGKQMTFSVAVVVLGAKMAKVDGVVNRREINAFKEVFRVPAQEEKNVARIFDVAKRDSSGFEPYARQVAHLFRREPAVLEDLLASLFFIANADGEIRHAELTFLRRIGELFNFDTVTFERVAAMFMRVEAADPYAVLGLTYRCSDADVKAAYRRLIREHHPDTLMARGKPKDFIAVANRKMAAINAAYDQIVRERGLK
jgi:DnaJ like chaperone protein